MPRFQLKSKTHYLTFPQSGDVTPQSCVNAIVNHFGDLEDFDDSNLAWTVVVQEQHQDGEHHLHALIHFGTSFGIYRSDYYDFVTGKHGDYKSVGGRKSDLQRVVAYLLKTDGDKAFQGISEEEFTSLGEKPEGAKLVAVVNELRAGSSVHDLIVKYPGQVLNIKKWEVAKAMFDYESMRVSVEPNFFASMGWNGIGPGAAPTGSAQGIITWFNTNLGGDRYAVRPIRSQQLWVRAPPGAGKTTLINNLRTCLNIYPMPYETFQDQWEDNRFDLCVLDEFKSQLPLHWLNSWLDGGIFQVKRKGIAPYPKAQNIPTVILSNYTPEECYPNMDATALEALNGRLLIINASIDDLKYLKVNTRAIN